MRTYLIAGALALASCVVVTGAFVSPTFAAATDYRFEAAGKQAHLSGDKAVMIVRLVHVPDGKPVMDAVIFEADMSPMGMATMTSPTTIEPASGDGLYRIDLDAGAPGPWAITLAAKVQGETETVRGSVVVTLEK
jgi:YtkA-like